MAHPTALQLFRIGHDTMSIASIYRITEAEAYNMLAREKDHPPRELSPASEPAPRQPRLVPYAGFDPHEFRRAAGDASS